MPVWSYIYLFLVFIGSCYLILSVKPTSLFRFAGESLSFFSYVSLFIISYKIIEVSHPFILSTLLLLYIVFWGVLAYKEFYSFYWVPATEFVKTVELGENETLEDAILSIKVIKSISLLFVGLLVLPLLYVYFKVI